MGILSNFRATLHVVGLRSLIVALAFAGLATLPLAATQVYVVSQ